MSEAVINGIFPTPVYISKLNRELTTKELLFIDESKLDVFKNEGNTTSNDNYILNHKLFKELKKYNIELKFILEFVNDVNNFVFDMNYLLNKYLRQVR